MTHRACRFPFRLGAGRCRLRLFRTTRRIGFTTVLFCTVIATYPPAQLLPLINSVRQAHEIDPDRLLWINHYPAARRLRLFPLPEPFVRLHLDWDGEKYTALTREPISRAVALDLVGTEAL